MTETNTLERKAIRREMRERRHTLTALERRKSAAALAANLFTLSRIRHARNLAAYLPVQGEIPLEAVIERAWSLHIPVYLPCLRGRALEFRRYLPYTPLRKNRFHIPEPVNAPNARIGARFLDVVLTPLVAFDDGGGRLGMGAGFYDRTFAFLRHRDHWHRPSLIGVAYEFQRAPGLPTADWDVPMQGVVTDATTRMF